MRRRSFRRAAGKRSGMPSCSLKDCRVGLAALLAMTRGEVFRFFRTRFRTATTKIVDSGGKSRLRRQKSSIPEAIPDPQRHKTLVSPRKPIKLVIARSEATRQSLTCVVGCRNDRNDTQASRESPLRACVPFSNTQYFCICSFFRMHVFVFAPGCRFAHLKIAASGLQPSSQ